MTNRLLPAPKRLALVAKENARGFAAISGFVAAWYAMLFPIGEGLDEWMEVAPTSFGLLVPLVVVGSFREKLAGGAGIWLQKPLAPVRFHLGRFLEVAFVALASTVLFQCAIAAIGLAGGWEPEAHVLHGLPAYALHSIVLVAVGFGLSCWWEKRGRLATVAYLALTVAAAFRMETGDMQEGPWVRVVYAVLLPIGPRVQEAALALLWSPGGDWRSAAGLVAYVAVWLAVGVVGIRVVAERRAK